MITAALYGHNSPETGYLVEDYPYGGYRTQIRFWLEHSPKKGYRYCSQTKNPKTGSWNNPKKSTYALIAANMYLDEKAHCHWRAITEYSSAEECLAFARDFPNSDSRKCLLVWCMKKAAFVKAYAEGTAYMSYNGVKQEHSEEEKIRLLKELEVWRAAVNELKDKGEGK